MKQRWHFRLRCWLIKKIAGKMAVVHQANIVGGVVMQNHIMLTNCNFAPSAPKEAIVYGYRGAGGEPEIPGKLFSVHAGSGMVH